MNVEYYIREFLNRRKQWFFDKEEEYVITKKSNFFNAILDNNSYWDTLEWSDLEKIAEHIHAFKAFPLAKTQAVNKENNENDIERFRNYFRNLTKKPLHNDKYNDIKERIKKADKALKYWSISSLSEIVGQRFPNDFIFYNLRHKEALKFLGKNLKSKNPLSQYIEFQRFFDEFKPLYVKHLKAKNLTLNYSIGIEIDQFFSWVYQTFVKEKGELITSGQEAINVLHSNIDSISIKNYFSIKDIKIENLSRSKEIYLLGENGVGKTLFLQAIILATKWHTLENSDGETSGKLRRFYQNKENKKLKITIEGSETNKSKDIDNEDISLAFVLKNEGDVFKKSLKNIFAYGINRDSSTQESKHEFLTLFGERDVLKNPIEWLTDLHNFEQEKEIFQLKNPNEPLPHHLQKSHVPLEIIKKFLKKILMEKVNVEINYKNVLFSENDTKNLTLDQLADGYKSVFTWVVDLIARLSENQPNARKLADFVGVVLIDELDLFLHVKWAQQIVSMLRKWFKNVQFIITTHSPILVLSASKDAVFYKLYKEDGETKITEPIKGLSDLMLNALVTSPLFGLSSARSKVFKNVENISNDDYLMVKIQQVLEERIAKNPQANENDYLNWAREELEKELTNSNNLLYP